MRAQPFLTPRLNARPITDGDEALYCGLYTDPQVMRHIGPPLSHEAATRAFGAAVRQARRADPEFRLWALSERGTGRGVGILAVIGGGSGDLELGAMLSPRSQGRGLAVEAQLSLLDWLFSHSDVGVVWSRNVSGNHAAARVRLKLGFTQVPAPHGDAFQRWQLRREQWRRPGSDSPVAETALER